MNNQLLHYNNLYVSRHLLLEDYVQTIILTLNYEWINCGVGKYCFRIVWVGELD